MVDAEGRLLTVNDDRGLVMLLDPDGSVVHTMSPDLARSRVGSATPPSTLPAATSSRVLLHAVGAEGLLRGRRAGRRLGGPRPGAVAPVVSRRSGVRRHRRWRRRRGADRVEAEDIFCPRMSMTPASRGCVFSEGRPEEAPCPHHWPEWRSPRLSSSRRQRLTFRPRPPRTPSASSPAPSWRVAALASRRCRRRARTSHRSTYRVISRTSTSPPGPTTGPACCTAMRSCSTTTARSSRSGRPSRPPTAAATACSECAPDPRTCTAVRGHPMAPASSARTPAASSASAAATAAVPGA